jgi:AraC-like DNA-binding protein
MSDLIWSGILFASALQCVFLLVVLLTNRKIENTTSRNVLSVLLFVTLLINASNLISSTYLYREIPEIAGFGRGMVLLLGPLFFFYFRSLMDDQFVLKWRNILHFIPYAIAIVFIRVQLYGVSDEIYITAVDHLMEGKIPITIASTFWFITYFLHLTFYLIWTRRVLTKSLNATPQAYRIGVEERKKWINKLTAVFIILPLLFLGVYGYSFLSGVFTATSNFLYTLILALMVYLISYQALLSRDTLTPSFTKKYGSNKISDDDLAEFRIRFKKLFETDKVFTQPDLRVANFAKMLNTQPHILSSFINSEYNKSFTEMVHESRIEEFKKRVVNNEHENFSIMGIAYDVGYSSKSVFNTAFKKHTGKTPSEYIRGEKG